LLLPGAFQRRGNRQAQLQLPGGKSVQALVSKGYVQQVEVVHGR
jgi:hypothetical protein